jgi:FMN-dependent NADH-azoreductase
MEPVPSPERTDDGGPVLLRVDSSPRSGSSTRLLTEAYVDAWSARHPDGRIVHHDLPALNLPHLGSTEMGAWFAEPAEHTELHELVLARSTGLIEDLLAADELVIGAPMWNLSIPSSLKCWIDHVVKAGRTISFGEHGPEGMVTARRAVVMCSRGSEYLPGSPAGALDQQEPYLRIILGFLGIADVRFVVAERQGPNYPDGATVLAAARAEAVDLVA